MANNRTRRKSSKCDSLFLSFAFAFAFAFAFFFSCFLLFGSQLASTSLEIITADLSFMKDQITVSEVNIARMHNHNVKLRQLAKQGATAAAQAVAASASA